MVDFHNHILPEMDDGSENRQMSVQILTLSAQQGIKTVVATPHFYANRDNPEKFLLRRQAAWEKLGQLPEGMPQLIPGAEIAFFNGMGRCEELTKLTIGNTRMLLVEMPFRDWSPYMIKELEQLSVELGLMPVLAHVDRYRGKNQMPRFFPELVNLNVLFQCNADAFLHLSSRRWAISMVKEGKLHFLGSDAHNTTTRSQNLGKAAEVICKKLGKEALDNLMEASRQRL